ncbi:MAG: hypothetical protein MZV64_56930 [Ignavibacteriales bacterium]|nr:hypothetical protein [Ignavibacteriales bacterium]
MRKMKAGFYKIVLQQYKIFCFLLTDWESDSCWIAIHGMDDVYKNIKAQFKLPENIVPVSLISLGYPDEVVKAEERFKAR